MESDSGRDLLCFELSNTLEKVSKRSCELGEPRQLTFDFEFNFVHQTYLMVLHSDKQRNDLIIKWFERFMKHFYGCVLLNLSNAKNATEYAVIKLTMIECNPVFLVETLLPLSIFGKCTVGDNHSRLFSMIAQAPRLFLQEHSSNKQFVKVKKIQHFEKIECFKTASSSVNMPLHPECTTLFPSALKVRDNYSIGGFNQVSTPPMPETAIGYFALKKASSSTWTECMEGMMQHAKYNLTDRLNFTTISWLRAGLLYMKICQSCHATGPESTEEENCASNTVELSLGTMVCGHVHATVATRNTKEGNTSSDNGMHLTVIHARSCQSYEHVARSDLLPTTNASVLYAVSMAGADRQRLDDVRHFIMTHIAHADQTNKQQINGKNPHPDQWSKNERACFDSRASIIPITDPMLTESRIKKNGYNKSEKLISYSFGQLPAASQLQKPTVAMLKKNGFRTALLQQSITLADKEKSLITKDKSKNPILSSNKERACKALYLKKSPVQNQIKQDNMVKVKANENEAGLMKPFFRQPTISTDFRKWTVAMMKTEVSKTTTLQPPTILGHPGMQNEWNRLATFADVRVPEGIFVILLAGNGFFVPDDSQGKNTKEGQVECAFCNVVVPIAMFIHVKPMDVHRKVSPRCIVVLGQRTGNLSIADAAQKTGSEFIKQFVPALPERFTVQCGSEMTPTLKGAQDGSEMTPTLKGAQDGSKMTSTFKGGQDGSEMTLSPNSMRDGSAMTQTQTHSPRQSADLAVDAKLPAVKRPAPGDVAPADGKPGASFAPFLSFSPQRVSTGQVVSDSHADKGRNTALPAPYQTATYVYAALAPDAAGPTLAANPPSGPGATKTDASSGAPAAAAAATTAQSGASPGGETSAPAGRTSNGQERQTVTYEDLGIISQRPKRPDMAVIQTRINTFTGWIHEQTHPKDEMAEAGFYYTGHEDLVRCFHCKGGLKTWESSDTPWVEHARWFPRCPFIRLCKGQRFIDAVQKLNDPKTRPTISQDAVTEEMQRLEEEERRNLGEEVVLFSNLPPRPSLPSDVLGGAGLRVDAEITVAGLEELAERLADENEEIRNLTLCKMCQTSEVNVLFLPCGHLVACAQCAPALTTCAMCRQPVKGSVRVHLDESKESQREERPPADGKPPAMV